MSNNWHTPTAELIPGDVARAEDVNDKFTAVDVAFDKLPEPHATEKGFAEAIHVGEPTEEGHAASRNFVETGMTSQVVAAAASATAAASSASSASTSATSATASASSATTSASTASTAATSAGNSATSATTSASSASTSATAAAASATTASTAATNASNSASAASTSASGASTSATNAAASASAAATSASAASSSATTASTGATTATTQASNASTSATNAATSASSASTSATNASNSATAAEASADLAELWAEEEEDVEVDTGQYSAKHWAAKAQLGASCFAVVTGNTGTATADGVGDAIAITGANGISVAATAGASAALSITPSYGSSISAVAAGVAAGAGDATTIARSNHVHNITTGAAATLSASTANAEGSSSTLARSDHLHTISTGAPSANLTASTSNAAGSAATLARSDHSHAITTAAASTINASSTNTAGTSASLARADHTHALSTGTPVALGVSASAGVAAGLSRSDHVHPYPTAANVGGVADPGSNGLMARTSANTSTARSIAGGVGVDVTNGDGASGNPTIVIDVPNDVRTVAVQRASTTTLADDLTVDLEIGTHRVSGFATFTSASSTPGVKFAFAGSAAWEELHGSIEMSAPTSYTNFVATEKVSVNRGALSMNALTQAITASSDYRIEWDLLVIVAAPITFKLQWAQNVSNATATERKAIALMESRQLPV